MKRSIFILLMCSTWNVWANGPKYYHKDRFVDDEFVNVYHDIAVRSSTRTVVVISSGSGGGSATLPLPGGDTSYVQITNSLQANSTFYVSSGTIKGTLNINNLTPINFYNPNNSQRVTMQHSTLPINFGFGPQVVNSLIVSRMVEDGTAGAFGLVSSTFPIDFTVYSNFTPGQYGTAYFTGSDDSTRAFNVRLGATNGYTFTNTDFDALSGTKIMWEDATPNVLVKTNASRELTSYDLFGDTPTYRGQASWTSASPSTFTTLAVTATAGIGTAPTATSGLGVSITSTTASGTAIGAFITATNNLGGGGNGSEGILARAVLGGSSGGTANMTGGYFESRDLNTTSIASMTGARPINIVFGSGTVTNSYAVNAANNYASLGQITNSYTYIEEFSISASTVTNHYGIFLSAPFMNVGGFGGQLKNRYAIYIDTQTAATNNNFGIYQVPLGGVNQLSTTTVMGHFISSGTTPSMGTCGTSPSVSGTDNAGSITVGGGLVTACTLNFSSAFINPPICTQSTNSTAVTADITSITTTAVTFGFSATLGGGTVWYICVGNKG